MIILNVIDNQEVELNPFKITDEGAAETIYELRDGDSKSWMRLRLEGNQLIIISQDELINEDEISIKAKLDELILLVIEAEQSGTALTDIYSSSSISPYNPESIKVQTKAFNVTLIADMIDKSYIDLTPDFQRNLVWNPLQKSRLIESILLRIPLPMFYFSEDDDGLITVVDGLQRLSAIKEFMDNKFPLKGLEYLSKTCEGKYYSDINKDGSPNGKIGLDPKYFRWFNMTQFTVNVIDPSSPPKVKYDIFKRINTGGKPLNNQEIRNCLASKNLRLIIKQMTTMPEFYSATDNSIKSTRMEDQEVALRFICFHKLYTEDSTLNNYNGNMEVTLDDATENLSSLKANDLLGYLDLFSRAMINAEHLFGKYAFRKIMPLHLGPGAHKQLINKALFISWTVLLSKFNPEIIKSKNEFKSFASLLAEEIENDRQLYNYLSFGTNGKANLQKAFSVAEKIINKHLNH